jgi:hypothetical protein
MGNEHNVYSEKWQEGAREFASSSCRSTKVLASLKLTNGDREVVFQRKIFYGNKQGKKTTYIHLPCPYSLL